MKHKVPGTIARRQRDGRRIVGDQLTVLLVELQSLLLIVIGLSLLTLLAFKLLLPGLLFLKAFDACQIVYTILNT